MLPLNPLPPQTDGERAFFAELARWDTGNAVRGAVVASIPFADGPLQRRLSDAVLIVPEGIAVVRVAQVVRQSGVVTASPEGPWTIGPARPGGAVLQLAGGGSTPLDGLMRAGMETAVRLRRAGLDPGRVARLTVLVGDVDGLLPADGDLGEGDQVALLDTRSLLLGIARASRYAGADNPRLWTTADVRAALEALGLQGRGPSVQELNGEGFPYSPYVLRRPQLLTPAAMAASPTKAEPLPPEPSAPPQAEGPTRASIEQAVAASVAAAAAAAEASAPSAAGVTTTGPVPAGTQPVPAPAAAPAAPAPGRAAPVAPAQGWQDTVAVDAPAAPPRPDGAGLGGLFGGGEPDTAPPRSATPPPTAVFPSQPAQAPAPQQALPPLFWDFDAAAGDEPESPGRTRRMLMVVAAALGLFLAGVGAWLLLGDRDDGGGSAAPAQPSDDAGPAGPEVGNVQEIGGVTYTLEAAGVDETCVGHSYDETAEFFAATDCTGLSRGLYSAEVGGLDVVVSIARVRMPDTAAARDLRGTTDTTGTGNVNDLLREDVRYPGSPSRLEDAEYASAVSGPTVTIVESAWVDPAAGGTAAEIDRIATDGLSLTTPPLPAD